MTPLKDFIAHARDKGMDHATIRLLLLSSGWKERDVITAMSEESLDMPVPVPQDGGNARDAFLHLLTFTALYASVISTMILLFQYVNRLLPDSALGEYADYEGDASLIRWQLAVLLVSFPLLAYLWKILHKEFVAAPEKLTSGVRRWLTYLTLFITACAMIGDTIALVFSLLQGELSLRFFIKVLIVFVLTGLPFGYYFSVLRMQPEQYRTWRFHKYFVRTGATLAALTFAWGIVVAGTPMYGRMQRFDEQRVSDLRTLQNEVYNIVYGEKRFQPETPQRLPKALPRSLDAIVQNAQYQRPNDADPATGEPYEYTVKGNAAFELCATFDLERNQQYDIFWNHPAGRHCFQFDALEPQGK